MSPTVRFSAFREKFRRRGTDGSAAIEFAFVAPIFFALMLGILQLGIMIFAQFTLQNAVTDAARLIRTGQAYNIDPKTAAACMGGATPGNYDSQQAWFNGQICCYVSDLLNCPSLMITVAKASSFGSGYGAYSGIADNAADYAPGGACDVVLVRASYPFPIWFPGLAQLLGGNWTFADVAGGSTHTISGTSAFRNEPFDSTKGGC